MDATIAVNSDVVVTSIATDVKEGSENNEIPPMQPTTDNSVSDEPTTPTDINDSNIVKDHMVNDLLSDMNDNAPMTLHSDSNPTFETSVEKVSTDECPNNRSDNDNQLSLEGELPVSNNATTTENITSLNEKLPDVLQKHEDVPISLEHVADVDNSNNHDVIAALQENLQNQMNAKAEAEDKVRRMEGTIALLEEQLQKQADESIKYAALHENLQLQMNAKAEAEHKARSAYDRIQQLENEKETNVQDLKRMEQELREARESIAEKDRELDKVRCDRDEYERKVTALTTRLNATKKKEALKVNRVDEIEDDLKAITEELEQTKKELEITKSAKNAIEQKLQYVEKLSKEHIEHLEGSLAEEQRLNDERKSKMMDYVETKTEELRQAKEENDTLQIDLSQTNRSLVELNNRWKQLHTQWVQAQTRNRELQRDLNRTKKDSEHLHKQGDTLEMKLSRSANETEEHKNKRIAAKQELMSVLRALEMEREVNAKLRDQIKFTFVPKMLNQQQTLSDALQDFSASIEKLSIRLGKPLPPLPEESERDETYNNQNGSPVKSLENGHGAIHSDGNPLVEKLELECQHVSSSINAVVNNVERLRTLVQAGGDRTCFTVLTELVYTGGMESSPALQASRTNISNPLALGRSHRYGQIPGTTPE